MTHGKQDLGRRSAGGRLPLRRDRRRRGSQRSDRRGLPGQGREKGARAGAPLDHRRRHGYRGVVPGLPALHLLLCLQSAAAGGDRGPRAGAPRLRGAPLRSSVLRSLPGWLVFHELSRRAQDARADRQVLPARRRRLRRLLGDVGPHSGADAAVAPATRADVGSDRSAFLRTAGTGGLAHADSQEHRRASRRVLRIRADQGAALAPAG